MWMYYLPLRLIAVVATVAGLFFNSSLASFGQNYVEPGRRGAPDSWVTAEFQLNRGLEAIKAHHAYAHGFTGNGVRLGVIDSGTWRGHPEFSKFGKLTGLTVTTMNGGVSTDHDGGLPTYESHNHGFDSHGTYVGGIMAAVGRDGEGMHSVAYNSNLYAIEGLWEDTIIPGLDALRAQGVRAINLSWGDELSPSVFAGIGDPHGNLHINTDGTPKLYGVVSNIEASIRERSFRASNSRLSDKLEEITRSGIVLVSAAGNDYSSGVFPHGDLPYVRPNPIVEQHTIAVVAVDVRNASQHKDETSNTCGDFAKLWCVAAPGAHITSLGLKLPSGVTGAPDKVTDLIPGHDISAGTSPAAPHVTGALGVVMERYPYMTSAQARTTLLTTATPLNYDPADLPVPIADVDNSGTWVPVYNRNDLRIPYTIGNLKVLVPNKIFGWGLINLETAMDGPMQFLGEFDVTLPATIHDIWSNDISDEAIRAQQVEVRAEVDAWEQEKVREGWAAGLPLTADGREKAYYEVREARARMFRSRHQQGSWQGSLTKRGRGTLSLRGNHSYRGLTRVEEGVLDLHGHTGIDSYGSLRGNVRIGPKGMLQGNAMLLGPALRVRGRIAPGDYVEDPNTIRLANSGNPLRFAGHIGRIEVSDSYTQYPGSTYLVDVDPTTSRSDLIVVGGWAAIRPGAKVEIYRTKNAPFIAGARYRILEAARGVRGNYAQNDITSPERWLSAFLVSSLVHDRKNIDLHIVKKRNLVAAARSRNTRAVARAIEGTMPLKGLSPGIQEPSTQPAAPVTLNWQEQEVRTLRARDEEVQTLSIQAQEEPRAQEAQTLNAQAEEKPEAQEEPRARNEEEQTLNAQAEEKPEAQEKPKTQEEPRAPAKNQIKIALENLPDDDSTEAALKQLSGEIYASMHSVLIEHSAASRGVVQDRLRSKLAVVGVKPTELAINFSQGYPPLGFAPAKSSESGAIHTPLSSFEVWGQATTNWQVNNGNAAKTSYRNSALIVGVDKNIDANIPLLLGVMAGYEAGTLNDKVVNSSVDSRNYYLGAYSGAKWRNFKLHGGMIYGHHGLKSDRQVSFKYFSDNLKAKYSARSVQLFAGLDYNFRLSERVSLAPFGDVAHINLKTNSFSERGGLAALRTTKSTTTNTTFTTLGLRGEFKLANLPVNLRLMAGWRRAFGATAPFARLRLDGKNAAVIAGVPIAKNAFVGGIGLDAELSKAVNLSLDYSTNLSKRTRSHRLSAAISVSF